ncbi:hypothetical protein D3C78_1217850 [compost metagenome]
MGGGQPAQVLLQARRQGAESLAHAGPGGVAAGLRDFGDLDDGAGRRPLQPAQVAVPIVHRGRALGVVGQHLDLRVAVLAREVGALGHLAERRGQLQVLLGGERLRGEEQYLEVQQRLVQLGAHGRGQRLGEVHALDAGGEVGQLRLRADMPVALGERDQLLDGFGLLVLGDHGSLPLWDSCGKGRGVVRRGSALHGLVVQPRQGVQALVVGVGLLDLHAHRRRLLV